MYEEISLSGSNQPHTGDLLARGLPLLLLRHKDLKRWVRFVRRASPASQTLFLIYPPEGRNME